MVTCNYNLRWDNVERLSNEQGNIFADTCSGCHDEENDDNIESVHNWELKNLLKSIEISLFI